MYASGDDFALSGAAILGLPMPGFGHTQYASIAMTTGGPDTADVYEETVDPDDPLRVPGRRQVAQDDHAQDHATRARGRRRS